MIAFPDCAWLPELRLFPGARHALAHTHARACAAAVREFLARRVSPAA